jgi:hypothetical protein
MIGKSTTEPAVRAEKVWRYLKFSRFVRLLQKKKLWLARADLLGDPWEITLMGDQLEPGGGGVFPSGAAGRFQFPSINARSK